MERNEFDAILNEIESGMADTHTAARLRSMTDKLFECPECHCLTDTLHGDWQVCYDCRKMIENKLRAESGYE